MPTSAKEDTKKRKRRYQKAQRKMLKRKDAILKKDNKSRKIEAKHKQF